MGLRVLLLDDDASFVAEAQASLEGIGCEVTSLRSGDSGLARATTDRFDLVVVSAELPSVNGFRLLQPHEEGPGRAGGAGVRADHGCVGAGAEGHRQLATRADVYLQKPVVMAELSRKSAPARARRARRWCPRTRSR